MCALNRAVASSQLISQTPYMLKSSKKSRNALYSAYRAWLNRLQYSRQIAFYALVAVGLALLGLFATSSSNLWPCSTLRSLFSERFRWNHVRPRSTLHWKSCYGKYQCTKLQVPLDYQDPDGAKAAIALYKLPASLDKQQRKYEGPILINPGGPGNPPFTMLQNVGERFQTLVGTEFDIIAFDPRGVGESTPQIIAFDDSAERETWTLLEPPLINATSDALSKRISRARVLNDLIKKKSGGKAQHVNSATVARDMLSIVHAHGRDQLHYWGQSYGATLGVTYAKLFPDNVGRMILDGGPDVNDYYSTKWASNLADTDKTVQAFYDSCASAGLARCAFHLPTPDQIKHRLDALYATVRARPVPGFESGSGVYGVVDYSTLQQAFHDAIYRPYDEFPEFARALVELEAGNGTRMLGRTKPQRGWCPKCGSEPRWNGYRVEGRLATMCTDGDLVTDSEEEFLEHYLRLAKDSRFADLWAAFRVGCSGWDVRPKWPVSGPFSANTSLPLLFIGNTIDPVSPLRYMHELSNNYHASVVLVQNAYGHCSTVAPSKCTDKWVRGYFRNGELPPPSTTCEVDAELFGNASLD